MTSAPPLVSIGVTTYNNPSGLRRTLECLTKQTYENLEIIVGDDCSPIDEIKETVTRFMGKDSRITYYRHTKNSGWPANAGFVLEKSSGEFFMWADDDDEWEPFFVERCLKTFDQLGEEYVAVMMESQYFSDSGVYDFFPQCQIFHDSTEAGPLSRISEILERRHGDSLLYSLYRRNALFANDASFPSILWTPDSSSHGHSLYISVLSKGYWRVIPQIGFRKKIDDKIFRYTKWQIEGGCVSKFRLHQQLKRLPAILRYNRNVLKSARNAIDNLVLDESCKIKLRQKAKKEFYKNSFYMFTKRKPRKVLLTE